jgi:hypothetical protein
MTGFWMVMSDTVHVWAPEIRHDTRAKARAEAERLALEYPLTRFFVLKAEGFAERMPIPVKWTDCDPVLKG